MWPVILSSSCVAGMSYIGDFHPRGRWAVGLKLQKLEAGSDALCSSTACVPLYQPIAGADYFPRGKQCPQLETEPCQLGCVSVLRDLSKATVLSRESPSTAIPSLPHIPQTLIPASGGPGAAS